MRSKLSVLVAVAAVIALTLLPLLASASLPVWPDPEKWRGGDQPQWFRFVYDGEAPHGWGVIYSNNELRSDTWKRAVIFFYDNSRNPSIPGKPVLGSVTYALSDPEGLDCYLRTEFFVPEYGRWRFLITRDIATPRPPVEERLPSFKLQSEIGKIFAAFALRNGAPAADLLSLVPYWELGQNERGDWMLYVQYPMAIEVPSPYRQR